MKISRLHFGIANINVEAKKMWSVEIRVCVLNINKLLGFNQRFVTKCINQRDVIEQNLYCVLQSMKINTEFGNEFSSTYVRVSNL